MSKVTQQTHVKSVKSDIFHIKIIAEVVTKPVLLFPFEKRRGFDLISESVRIRVNTSTLNNESGISETNTKCVKAMVCGPVLFFFATLKGGTNSHGLI